MSILLQPFLDSPELPIYSGLGAWPPTFPFNVNT